MYYDDSHQFQIPANGQSGLSNGSMCGRLLGYALSGEIADRLGYRWTLIGYHTMMTGAIFLLFFATGRPMLLAGEILCGIPDGIFQILSTTYAREITPAALWAYLSSYEKFVHDIRLLQVQRAVVSDLDWEWP